MSGNGSWHGKKYYFGFHKDIHVMAADTYLGQNLEVDELVRQLKLTGADFVQTDSKGHPGLNSWHSETPAASVGPIHQDILKVWRAATKKLGLPLHAHYSGIYEVAAGKKFPDWTVKGADGQPVIQADWGGTPSAGGYMCPRSPYLDRLMIPQLLEMIDRYGIDGFWIDGDIWAARPCYCDRCRAAFTKKTGLVAPSDEELPSKWQVFAQFSREDVLPKDWFVRIPETLEVAGRNLMPQTAQAVGGRLDLAPLLSGKGEGRSALVYIPFTTDREQKMTFGLGADWWFDAYLDGVRLGDTLATGNPSATPSADDYQKTLTVAAGTHLLAIRFISGPYGSVLAASGKNTGLWRTWIDFTFDSFEEYVTRYCDAVHTHKPGTLITSNWLYTVKRPGEPKAPIDWISGDLSFGVDACRTEARFISTRGKPWDMMLWSFCYTYGGLTSSGWSPVMKPAAMLQQEAATVIACGGNVQVCENPIDGFRTGDVVSWRMKRLGELGRFLHRRRSLCQDTVTIPQIAVLHSEHHLRNLYAVNHSFWKADLSYLEGAVYSLLECHYGVDILDEWALLPRLAEFPAVVVPEEENLSDAMVEALKKYVADGGKLLVTGAATFERFGADFFCAAAGTLTERTVYHVVIPDGVVPAYSASWRLLGNGNAKRLGDLGTTQHPNEYRLPYPAAILNRVGKGKVAYIPCDICREYKRNLPLREYLRQVMRALVGRMDIELEGPTAVDMVLRRKDRQTIIHLINRSNGMPAQIGGAPVDEIPAVGPLTISIKTTRKPKNVKLQFEDGRLNWKYAGGKVIVNVASVGIHAAVVISE